MKENGNIDIEPYIKQGVREGVLATILVVVITFAIYIVAEMIQGVV